MSYIIAVTKQSPDQILHHADVNQKVLGVFHDTIPIKVLDDFQISIKMLPLDPDDMNARRSSWDDDTLCVSMKNARGDEKTKLVDLLCNLMHWCDRHDKEFADCLQRAIRNYKEQTRMCVVKL